MEMEAPGATLGKLSDSGQLASLDAKLASALSMILTGEAMRATNKMKEQMAPEGKLMKGREILFEVYKNTRISEAEGSILDFRDILQVKLYNDQLITCLDDGEYVLGAMRFQPSGIIPESLFYQQANRSQSTEIKLLITCVLKRITPIGVVSCWLLR